LVTASGPFTSPHTVIRPRLCWAGQQLRLRRLDVDMPLLAHECRNVLGAMVTASTWAVEESTRYLIGMMKWRLM
jgi:hypothetical protein